MMDPLAGKEESDPSPELKANVTISETAPQTAVCAEVAVQEEGASAPRKRKASRWGAKADVTAAPAAGASTQAEAPNGSEDTKKASRWGGKADAETTEHDSKVEPPQKKVSRWGVKAEEGTAAGEVVSGNSNTADAEEGGEEPKKKRKSRFGGFAADAAPAPTNLAAVGAPALPGAMLGAGLLPGLAGIPNLGGLAGLAGAQMLAQQQLLGAGLLAQPSTALVLSQQPTPAAVPGPLNAMLEMVKKARENPELTKELQTLRARLEQLSKMTKDNPEQVLVDKDGKPEESPEPTYDGNGKRTNTRTQRAMKKIQEERLATLERLLEVGVELGDPRSIQMKEFAEKNKKHSERVYFPTEKYPDCDFKGQLIGVRGATQKRLCAELNVFLEVRGRGIRVKQGKTVTEEDDLPQHCKITAPDKETLEAAVAKIKSLLVPLSEAEKKNALREIAIANGTLLAPMLCHNCGQEGHKTHNCPNRHQGSWKAANVACTICGSNTHPTQDCPNNRVGAARAMAFNLENDYEEFLKEIGYEESGSDNKAKAPAEQTPQQLPQQPPPQQQPQQQYPVPPNLQGVPRPGMPMGPQFARPPHFPPQHPWQANPGAQQGMNPHFPRPGNFPPRPFAPQFGHQRPPFGFPPQAPGFFPPRPNPFGGFPQAPFNAPPHPQNPYPAPPQQQQQSAAETPNSQQNWRNPYL